MMKYKRLLSIILVITITLTGVIVPSVVDSSAYAAEIAEVARIAFFTLLPVILGALAERGFSQAEIDYAVAGIQFTESGLIAPANYTPSGEGIFLDDVLEIHKAINEAWANVMVDALSTVNVKTTEAGKVFAEWLMSDIFETAETAVREIYDIRTTEMVINGINYPTWIGTSFPFQAFVDLAIDNGKLPTNRRTKIGAFFTYNGDLYIEWSLSTPRDVNGYSQSFSFMLRTSSGSISSVSSKIMPGSIMTLQPGIVNYSNSQYREFTLTPNWERVERVLVSKYYRRIRGNVQIDATGIGIPIEGFVLFPPTADGMQIDDVLKLGSDAGLVTGNDVLPRDRPYVVDWSTPITDLARWAQEDGFIKTDNPTLTFDDTGTLVEIDGISLDNLHSMLSGNLTGILGILQAIFNGIINLPTRIADAFKTAFQWIVDTIIGFRDVVTDFFKGFWEALKNLMLSLFVPSEGVINNNFNLMKNQLYEKFPLIPQLSEFINNVIDVLFMNRNEDVPVFIINWHGNEMKIIDFTYFQQYRTYIHGFILVIAYFFYGRKLLRKIPKVLGGFH
ncbi:MAG: hypothetical protein FWG70_01055 [Oscillospiraceae bacterium]|nr:hypothetical protein [Oscillospiraceae bacterium]